MHAVKMDQGFVSRSYPLHIKYMGSKARIIDFVVEGINSVYEGGPVCDLFAGACSLSGALGNQVQFISNDIQNYSKFIAQTYLHKISNGAAKLDADIMCAKAAEIVALQMQQVDMKLSYDPNFSLDEFNKAEIRNQSLINQKFSNKYHLFLKCYAGTWWSAEQCAWIDALRCVADTYLNDRTINEGDHSILLTCIMHAMAYTGQGTGHYAQYRDAKTESSLADIKIYRKKSVSAYFTKKFNSLVKWNLENVTGEWKYRLEAMDYTECLRTIDGGTVYADPPYAFVHYSRFYHAIETFVLYDYPKIQFKNGKMVKGRYRENRHQSPFSIRSKVEAAFSHMFDGVAQAKANLVLSYSNTALLELDNMIDIAKSQFGESYEISTMYRDHIHMTMGRKADRNRNVEEVLLTAKRL